MKLGTQDVKSSQTWVKVQVVWPSIDPSCCHHSFVGRQHTLDENKQNLQITTPQPTRTAYIQPQSLSDPILRGKFSPHLC